MQQLILTLIALLGLFVPTANSRIAKFFLRFVPPMASGRVAFEAIGNGGASYRQPRRYPGGARYGAVQSILGELVNFMKGGEDNHIRTVHDSLQCRIRRAQRAAACRTKTSSTRKSRFHAGFFTGLVIPAGLLLMSC